MPGCIKYSKKKKIVFKGLVHPKMKICCSFTHPYSSFTYNIKQSIACSQQYLLQVMML